MIEINENVWNVNVWNKKPRNLWTAFSMIFRAKCQVRINDRKGKKKFLHKIVENGLLVDISLGNYA